MAHPSPREIDVLTEKEEAQAVQIEHAPSVIGYEAAEVEPRMNLQTCLAFLALASQYNAYVLTLLIPSTTLSYINADLGPNPNFTWITVSWTLCASFLISISGRLSDIFGRRYFMICGSVISFIGTIVGATGKSINQMIASGILFGLGSGFQEMGYAACQEIVPNKYRMWAIGIFDILGIIGQLGPIVAYTFLAKTEIGWRGAYWYMCAFHGFFMIVLVLTYYPPKFSTKHRHDGKTKMQLVKEIDYIGLFLFIAGCVLFLLGINYGGRQYPWNSAHVIAPMVVGVLCLVGLGFYEAYADLPLPIMPPKIFKKWREVMMLYVVCFVGGMLYYSLNVTWPRQSQLLYTGPNKIIQGLYAELIPLGSIASGLLVAFVIPRIGHERWTLVTIMIIETALIGSMASLTVDSRIQAIATVPFLNISVATPQLMVFAMISLGLGEEFKDDIGCAVGLAGTFRLLGGSVATAIYTAINNNTFAKKLPNEVLAAAPGFSNMSALIKAAALNTAAAYKTVPGITNEVIAATQMAVKEAYVQAYKVTYLSALGFGALAIGAAMMTKSTDKHMKNNKRIVRLENEKVKEDEMGMAPA
ncbi:MFS general substrate transporter [Paraphaeosphaeria sporulosa]|uniref:MFS general substrate transporter n=1 Tax=Paraphaeosphaeria sporulosa TaxID=1460663 RepID=A0A177CKH9_9PLEO|nr:MFS general substrate transporter [Paraphaeosphaeria sporulosa]OAG07378.1 MFS general substrate transporter [Paraphaeosphaeria sporulosa]